MLEDARLLSVRSCIAEVGLAETREMILTAEVFDPHYYRASYADVREASDPLDHFIMYGIDENRRPSLWFDPDEYLEMNADVAAHNYVPVLHYSFCGRQEDRPGTKDIAAVKKSGLFDPVFYFATYPDVEGFASDPLYHYMMFGAYENRQPSAILNLDVFFTNFPEVRPTECNPILYQLHMNKRSE